VPFEPVQIEALVARDAGPIAPAKDAPVEAASGRPASRRGRRPKYDWDAFDAELVRIVGLNGLLDSLSDDEQWKSQADLERHMADWCQTRWGEAGVPAESTIREHVSKRLAATREGQ
jgi:hypothetical protein